MLNGMIVDNFAGGGGASTGIEMGLGAHIDVAINHDGDAVAMHRMNHPQTKHLQQSVWKADPQDVCGKRPVRLAWFSPDCKHFSKAKGGKPVEHHIRDLAWVVVQWARRIKPDVIMLENVEEFKDWGPLISTADGKLVPCPLRKGLTFRRWVRELKKCGYVVEYRELRACDYGAPTIRKRLFLIARSDGKPIVWPTPTHGTGLIPYRTAAECIDWSIPCPSIFTRKKALAENTLKRVAKGMFKYVIDAERPFIVNLTHHGSDRVESIDEPFNTITGAHRGEKALVTPYIARVAHGEVDKKGRKRGKGTHPVDEPLPTVVGSNEFAVVTPFITKFRTGSTGSPLDEPLHTITAGGDLARDAGNSHAMGLVAPTLIQVGYGEADGQAPRALDIEKPLGTIVGSGKHALVETVIAPIFVGAGGPAYSGKPTSVDKPFKAQTTENHTALVSAFLAQHNGERKGGFIGAKSVDAPISTLTATGAQQGIVAASLINLKGTHRGDAPVDGPTFTQTSGGYHIGEVRAFLLKYYGNEQEGVSLTDPMHTVTAKDRFGLVTIQGVDYQIVDIGMRMLSPRELFRAQSFPDTYKIEHGVDAHGNIVKLTKTAQVRLCGNSVPPVMAMVLSAANLGPDLQSSNLSSAL